MTSSSRNPPRERFTHLFQPGITTFEYSGCYDNGVLINPHEHLVSRPSTNLIHSRDVKLYSSHLSAAHWYCSTPRRKSKSC